MSPRGGTTSMSSGEVTARAAQAHSFLEAARLTVEFSSDLGVDAPANVAASNAVLAGIAAADAICGKALGIRSSSPNHLDAVALLRRAHGGSAAANHLSALVSIKNDAAYEPRMVTSAKSVAAILHAERLVDAMDRMLR